MLSIGLEDEPGPPSLPSFQLPSKSSSFDPNLEILNKLDQEIKNQTFNTGLTTKTSDSPKMSPDLEEHHHLQAPLQGATLDQSTPSARQSASDLKVDFPAHASSNSAAEISSSTTATADLQSHQELRVGGTDLEPPKTWLPQDSALSIKDQKAQELTSSKTKSAENDPLHLLKVDVPKLPETGPPFEGGLSSQDIMQTVFEQLKDTVIKIDPEEEQKMRWAPINVESLRPIQSESIEPTTDLLESILHPATNVTAASFLERSEIPRYLDWREDDVELAEDRITGEASTKPDQSLRNTSEQAKDKAKECPNHKKSTIPSSISPFGTLSSFLSTRKIHKKPKVEAEPAASSLPPNEEPSHTTTLPTFTIPEFSLTEPRSIILKTSLLTTHSSLTKTLEAHPALHLIFRDPPITNSPSALSAMPDILLSQTTCLVLTSLSSTTDRSLPTQGSSSAPSPLQAQLTPLVSSFTQIFVLAIFPPSSLSSTLGNQMSALQNLCAQLSSSVTPTSSQNQDQISVKPLMVPHSQSAEPLAATVLSLISHHTTPHSPSSPPLNPHSTTWETFLVHAGLNPYAAGVVLGKLRKTNYHNSNGNPDSTYSNHTPSSNVNPHIFDKNENEWEGSGLSGLLHMSPAERQRSFGAELGERAVERLGRVLDVQWR